MTSRLLQTSLSPVVTRARNISNRRSTLVSNLASVEVDTNMPVIHAVAAHRHCHNLCPQPSSFLKVSCDRLQTKIGSGVRTRRSLSYLTSEPVLERRNSPVPPSTGWLKIRNKSFLTSGKVLNFNIFGSASISDGVNNENHRFYAKMKDKGAKKKSVVVINEEEMNEVIDVDLLKRQLEGVLKQMKDEYASQLSIRGAAGALELLEVEFEGEKYPLQELAQVGRKNPQLAVLNLASLPDACQPVLKAIQESGMQLNPQQEGTTIYIALPKVTREHRENLAKNAKVIFTKYKTSFQQVQNRFVKESKSHKAISEDVVFSVTQQIMRLAEKYIAEAEKVLQDKQKELLDIIS